MSENTYFDMNRRSFLKSTAAAGALVLGTYFMGGAPRAMAGVLAKPAENAKGKSTVKLSRKLYSHVSSSAVAALTS